MYIKRHLSKVLLETRANAPSILVTGARQVGKSTLLKETFKNLCYVSLDDFTILSKLRDDPLFLVKSTSPPLIIDEVQYAPDVMRSIKLRIDTKRQNGLYFMTGSQSFLLMKGVSESLAGRVALFELLGLSSRELDGESFDKPFFPTSEYFAGRNPANRSVNLPTMWKRIHRGYMPELHANQNIDGAIFYRDYFRTYIERDVRALGQVGDEISFSKFVAALAARTGELLNIASISREIGISEPTLKKWLSVLRASNIIHLMEPFSLNANTRVAKTPKVYFFDTGLVCFLCGWTSPHSLEMGAQSGSIFETFVVGEILKSYYNAGRMPPLYYYRDNHSEIDLLFWENGLLHPVEIKKTSSPNSKDIRHFRVLQTAFPNARIGEGGIICTYDSLLSFDERNNIIPLGWI